MPLTLVQGSIVGSWGGTTTGAGTGSISVSWAQARTSGNVLFLACNSDSTESTPSGWNLVNSVVTDSGTYLWYRIADNTSTDTPTFSSAFHKCIAWAEYSGNTATPQDKTASANSGGITSGAQSTGTTATTSQGDELAVAVWGSADTSSISWSSLTNSFSKQVDETTTAGSSDVSLAIGVLTLSATQTVTSSATPSNVCYKNGIVGTFKASASTQGTARVWLLKA